LGRPGLREIRGVGLMIGLELAEGRVALDVVKTLMAEGLLTIPAGERVVRLLPPLNVSEAEIAEAAGILARVL
jgi:acetylornithine/N-succinyldiaminopimelate aminotransferase